MANTPYPLPRQTRESTIQVGNGTAGPYGPSLYRVFDIEDVRVYLQAEDEESFTDVTSNCVVTKTAGEGYDTFSVMFAGPVPATSRWYHAAKRVANRSVAVTRAGTLVSDELEKELSKQATVLQELRRDFRRSLHIVDPIDLLPLPQPEPGKVLAGNSTGDGFVNAPMSEADLAAEVDAAHQSRIGSEQARDASVAAADAANNRASLARAWAESATPPAGAGTESARTAANRATAQAGLAATEADRAALARDAAEDAVQYDYLVADNTALNAIVGMTSGQRAFVRSTEHVWHYDGAAWVDDGLAPTAQKANKSDVDGLRDSLMTVQQVVGVLEDPLTDGAVAASAGTYTFGRPIAKDGKGIVFNFYSRAAGTVRAQIVSRSGITNTVVRELAVAASAGVNRFAFPEVEYFAGQFVGIRTEGGFVAFTANTDGNNGGFWAGSQTSEGNSYDDASLGAGEFKVRFELQDQIVTGERVLEQEVEIAGLRTQIGNDDATSLAIGRPLDATLVDGVNVGNSTYAYVFPAEEALILEEVRAFVRVPGVLKLRVFDDDGANLVRSGDDVEIQFGSSGEHILTNVPGLILRPGQRVGLHRGTCYLATTTDGGDSGGLYIGTGDVTNFAKGGVNSSARIQLSLRFKPYTLTERVAILDRRVEDIEQNGGGGGGEVDLLPHDTHAFHLVWMLGESHVVGQATTFSSDIPSGRGYRYRRATTSLEHLQDPTGNSGNAIVGEGRGSWGPPVGQTLLDMTHGAAGAIIVNSGHGSTTVANWASAGGAWTQAKADWDSAIAAIKAAKLPVSGVSVVVGIGSNDAYAGTSKAAFKAGLLDLIERARAYVAAGDAVPVSLVMTGPFANGDHAAAVLDCQQAQAELARGEPGIFMATSAPKFAHELGWFMDNVHFNQTANMAIGPAIAVVALTYGAGLYPAGLE